MLNKSTWFRIIAMALPVLVIVVVESGLRIGGYGEDYRLFIEADDSPGYVVMNPRIAEKYFSRKENATIGYFETFKRKKDKGTFRIFIMGASTAVGYPYFHNGSFHRMLKFLLQKTYPDLKIEVINTSLTAINSYTLLDFAKKIVHYEPDAVLIYAGHNEYYGALGAASTGFLGNWPGVINFTMSLRQLRLWQLLSNFFQKISGWIQPVSLQENLMRRMSGAQLVAYGSPVFNAGLKQYKTNLEQILQIFNGTNTPVFLASIVSNEKDQKPFVSSLQPQTDSSDFYLSFQKMKEAFESGAWKQVEKLGLLLSMQDSTHAENYYLLGQKSLAADQPGEAKKYFTKARRHDHLRFRAPDEINHIIRNLCLSTDARLVNVQKAFEAVSPSSLLGEELLLEHLHPNLRGYSLIAESFYKSIIENKIIKVSPETISISDQLELYPLTTVDTLHGSYEIQILKERWPFYEKIDLDTANRTIPEAVAGALVVKQLSWDQAMDRLYRYYHEKSDFEYALRVAEAVIMEHPNEAALYAKAGSICLRLRDFEKGAYYFLKAYNHQPSAEYARFTALCLIHQNKLEQSLQFLTNATARHQTDQKTLRLLSAIQNIVRMESRLNAETPDSELLNQLAGSYYVIGLENKARTLIFKVLATEPSNSRSLKLLQQINQKRE